MTKTVDGVLEEALKKSFDRGMSTMNKNIDENGQFKAKHISVVMTDIQALAKKEMADL
jgi:hypothetical protein